MLKTIFSGFIWFLIFSLPIQSKPLFYWLENLAWVQYVQQNISQIWDQKPYFWFQEYYDVKKSQGSS